ncbi:MAG: hypothetical protein Q8P89_00300 [bacterium]|nr:hypothetical protein [bacterium]
MVTPEVLRLASVEDSDCAEYLTIKADGAELQVRVDPGSLSQPSGKESFSFDLEGGSANGTIVAWLITGQEVRSGVANGTILRSPSPLTKLAFRFCQMSSPGDFGWVASLEGEDPSKRLLFKNAIVIAGSPTTLDRDGQIVLENGRFNPQFFAGTINP